MLVETSRILFLLLIIVVLRIDSRKSEMPQRSKAYLNAFRNIPRLFDYLLETLDERPEILEKNDADVFKRNADHEDDASVSNVYLFKRSVGNENDVTYFGLVQNDENNYIDDSYGENDADDISDYVESENGDKSGEEKSEYENMVAYSGLGYEAFTTLTPDEVAENALKVEDMLEEHNNRK